MALPFRGGSGGGRFNPRFQRQQEPEHRINERIRVPQVRLVGDNIEVGIYSTQEALKIAQSLELDLVEISPQADPPVCKAIDYKKFLYEKKKKEKEKINSCLFVRFFVVLHSTKRFAIVDVTSARFFAKHV